MICYYHRSKNFYIEERKETAMANEKKLDCVILGLLSHEDLTGYEIKKRMDTVLKYFWGASFGSIYPTLSNLVDRGLATKREDTKSKRNKQIYTITEDGRNYLKNWLTLPVEKDEIRFETLLKVFFAGSQDTIYTLSHIETFQGKTEKELSALLEYEKKLKSCLNEDAAHKYYLLTVDFAIKTYQAYLSWCKEVKRILRKSEG